MCRYAGNKLPHKKLALLFLTFSLLICCGCSNNDAHTHDSSSSDTVSYNFEVDESDTMLEFDVSDLYDGQSGTFLYPGIPWELKTTELSSTLGVDELPAMGTLDPQLWFTTTADGVDIRFLPEFQTSRDDMTLEYIELKLTRELTENLPQKRDALLHTMREAFGEPTEEVTPMTTGDGTAYDSYSYLWEGDSTQAKNRLYLVVDCIDEQPARLYIMLTNVLI